MNLPSKLDPDDETEHMGICEKHWKEGYEVKSCARRRSTPSSFIMKTPI